MHPLIFRHAGYAIAFWLAGTVWGATELFINSPKASEPGADRRDQGSRWVVVGTMFVGIFAGSLLANAVLQATINWQRPALVIAGIVLVLAGVALRQWAVHTLGRYFTMDVATRADQPVIQNGPYRFVRHPSYSGVLVSALGLGLALTNWLALVVMLAMVWAGLAYRVRIEERALREALGTPYVAYASRTPRFIPWPLPHRG